MARNVRYPLGMTHWIRIQGALALIALSIGWAIGALVCGALADAGTDSVLWASFQRLFLVLAMGASALGIAMIFGRSLRRWRSTWMSHGLPCLVCLVGVAAATWWAIAAVVTTGSSVMIIALTLTSLLLLERRRPSSAHELAAADSLAQRRTQVRDLVQVSGMHASVRDGLDASHVPATLGYFNSRFGAARR